MGPVLTARRAGTAPPSDAVPVPRVLAAVGLRGLGAGIALVQNALLARVAGSGGLGLYFMSHSWSRVVGTAAGMGLPPYVLRRSAALRRQGRAAEADRLVVRSRRLGTVVGLGAAAAALVVLVALRSTGSIGWSTFAVAASAAVGAVAFAFTRLLADALKARGEPEAALTVEFGLPNVLLCGALAVVLSSGVRLSVGWMLAVVTTTVVVVPVLGWSWWDRRLVPSTAGVRDKRDVPDEPDDAAARADAALAPRSLASLTALSGLNILLWAQPTLLMPCLVDDAADIGRFGVAQRVVAVASLNIVALGSHFAPRFAAADAMRQPGALRREAQRAAALALASYLPFFVVFVGWPGAVLRLFGDGFDRGTSLLVIMAVGQLANAATGLCSEVLVMSGHERDEVASTAVGAVAMFVATLVAGTAFGAVGVATAFAAAVALRNAVSFVLMRRATRRDLDGPA